MTGLVVGFGVLLSYVTAGGQRRPDNGCSSVTSVSMTAFWANDAAPNGTDLFYLALSASRDDQPLMLQTAVRGGGDDGGVAVTLQDLLPGRTYTLRWRAHPANTGRNIGWDWIPFATAFSCTTAPSPAGAPVEVQRVGALHENRVTVGWRLPPSATPRTMVRVGHRRLRADPLAPVSFVRGGPVPPPTDSDFTLTELADPLATSATIDALAPGSSYEVVVVIAGVPTTNTAAVSNGSTAPVSSDPVLFRTAAAGFGAGQNDTAVRYTTMARISEFTDDVDFLDNHDSATPAALAVLMATWAKQVNVSSDCITGLSKLCPRAQGKPCLSCVSGLDPGRIPASCGTAAVEKYNTNFFCGEGWPSFSMFSTPMAAYCVHSQPAPVPESPTNAAGWAEYTSCDAPEAGEANQPTNPVCICWCSWDRSAVSNTPKAVYDRYCHKGPDGQARCTCADAVNDSSIFIRPDAPSAVFVGKSPVMLPYIFFQTPRPSYPNTTHVGDNFGTPAGGSCSDGAALGDGGCTWKREAPVRIIYHDDLIAHGWNASLPRDTPADQSGSLHNIAAMEAAWKGLDAHIAPRCCGC